MSKKYTIYFKNGFDREKAVELAMNSFDISPLDVKHNFKALKDYHYKLTLSFKNKAAFEQFVVTLIKTRDLEVTDMKIGRIKK